MAPLIPSAKYNFGATVCPELPIWRSIGSQPSSQIGLEAAISAPIAFATASACEIFSGALMPRPTATISGACVKSTADFASLNSSSGLVRICSAFNSIARRSLVRAERARLKRREPWAFTEKRDVRSGFPLKHLPHENQFAVFVVG